jgi:hypothetical protein
MPGCALAPKKGRQGLIVQGAALARGEEGAFLSGRPVAIVRARGGAKVRRTFNRRSSFQQKVPARLAEPFFASVPIPRPSRVHFR